MGSELQIIVIIILIEIIVKCMFTYIQQLREENIESRATGQRPKVCGKAWLRVKSFPEKL